MNPGVSAIVVAVAAVGAVPVAAQQKPWENDPIVQPAPQKERLGPGPYILVITDRGAVTRIDYRSGAACQKARDAVRRQAAPPPSPPSSNGYPGIIYGAPSLNAVCVPR